MKSEEEILVDVGGIPLETVENWALNSARFKEVISDEKRLQEAFALSQERLKNIGVPMSYIEEIPRELFDETVKTALMVSYARGAVQGFFNCKTVEEIESETVFNEDWIIEAVENAILLHMEAVVSAVEKAMIRDMMTSGIAVLIGGFNCRDESGNLNNDADDDSES